MDLCNVLSFQIVVSPLKALINDQVLKLKDLKLKVLRLDGENTWPGIDDITKLPCLLYVTPEAITSMRLNGELTHWLESKWLAGIVVDEAHCLLDWSSFRDSYAKLEVFKELDRTIPIMAVSATITSYCEREIAYKLAFDNYEICRSSSDRPNLLYSALTF